MRVREIFHSSSAALFVSRAVYRAMMVSPPAGVVQNFFIAELPCLSLYYYRRTPRSFLFFFQFGVMRPRFFFFIFIFHPAAPGAPRFVDAFL